MLEPDKPANTNTPAIMKMGDISKSLPLHFTEDQCQQIRTLLLQKDYTTAIKLAGNWSHDGQMLYRHYESTKGTLMIGLGHHYRIIGRIIKELTILVSPEEERGPLTVEQQSQLRQLVEAGQWSALLTLGGEWNEDFLILSTWYNQFETSFSNGSMSKLSYENEIEKIQKEVKKIVGGELTFRVNAASKQNKRTQKFLWNALTTALQPAIETGKNGVVSLYSYTTILRMMAVDNPAFSAILEREGVALTEPPAHDQLLSVNSCWLQKGAVTPTPATLAGLKAFGVQPVEVDFREGTAAAKAINEAIAQGTQGRISEMLPEEELAGKLREAIALYLNTLCYTGAWETAFKPERTQCGNFYSPQGTVTPEFMISKEEFITIIGYDDLCSATVGNVMKDGQTLFCAMMPHEHVSMTQLLERLAQGGITSWGGAEFELHLPKFTIAGETNLSDLFPALVPASMPGLGWDGTPVRIMQKASLKIDEQGVEAAAATMWMASKSIPQRTVFDRPFLVFILNAQDEPIFAAVVNNPVR